MILENITLWGGSDYQLYLSRQQIEEENESLEIGKLIRSQFINSYSDMTKLSVDKLRKIKAIINEV